MHQLSETISGISYQRKDSEYWHGKAVELAISFLPSECPLVSHVLMSYEKHHAPSNMVIPEDTAQDVKVRIVRQITGVDSNRLQPIIRYHPDIDYRIKKILIEPLDYYLIHGQPNQSQNNQEKQTSSSIRRNRQADLLRKSLQNQANYRPSSNKQTFQTKVQDKDDQIVEEQPRRMKPSALEQSILSPVAISNQIPTKARRVNHNNQDKEESEKFVEIQITEKDRQRSHENGLSKKHRRLQTSEIYKHWTGARMEEGEEIQGDLEPEFDPDNPDQGRKFAQERRAKSSLSNRTNQSGPAVDPIQQSLLPSSNLLSQYVTGNPPQRLTLNPDLAKHKNHRHISESLDDPRTIQRKQISKIENQILTETGENLMQSNNQLQNSLKHRHFSTQPSTTQNFNGPQQKGAAPITDIRKKPQSGTINEAEFRQSQQNINQAANAPKFKQPASEKANLANQLNQQMLLVAQQNERQGQVMQANRSSKNQLVMGSGLIVPQQKVKLSNQNNSVVPNEQMTFFIQQKRERFNQSQIVQTRGLDDAPTNTLKQTSEQLISQQQIYAARKTPNLQQLQTAIEIAKQQSKGQKNGRPPQLKQQLDKANIRPNFMATQILYKDSGSQLTTSFTGNALNKKGEASLRENSAAVDQPRNSSSKQQKR